MKGERKRKGKKWNKKKRIRRILFKKKEKYALRGVHFTRSYRSSPNVLGVYLFSF